MTSPDFLVALARATMFTSASVAVVWLLTARVGSTSPRVLRVAWLIAIAQGWLLFTWTLRIESVVEARPVHSVIAIESAPGTLATLTVEQETAADVIQSWSADATADWPIVSNWLLGVWAAGCLAMILVRVRRYTAFLRRLTSQFASGVEGAAWQDEWRQQLAAAGVRRRAELRMTRDLGPLVCFVPFHYLMLTPRILWEKLTRPQRVAILRHELAHLRRRDVWKSLAIRLVALPQWFNPLVWLAVRRFDEAGEWACDAECTGADEIGCLHLAQSLVRAAEFATTGVPAAASAQGGVLSRRIRRLVTPPTEERSIMKKSLLLTLLAALVAAQAIRIEHVAAAPQEAPPVPQVATAAPLPTTSSATAAELHGTKRRWNGSEPYVIEPPDILTLSFGKLALQGPGAKLLPASGEHLVGPDGRVNLGGEYGSVYVAGKTIEAARTAIQAQLSHFFGDPQVTVDIYAYNSKKVYIVTQGGSRGDDVTALPFTGNETVLDAITASGGFPTNLPHRIWIARPSPDGDAEQILPVNWQEILAGGSTKTNYQLMPGDRLYIAAEQLRTAYATARYSSAPSQQSQVNRHRIFLDDVAPDQRPAAVAMKIDGETVVLQLVAAENGATVGSAMSQVKRWLDPDALAKVSIWLERGNMPGDAHEELPITWEAAAGGPTKETDYVLKPGDLVVISDRSPPAPAPTPPAAAIRLANPPAATATETKNVAAIVLVGRTGRIAIPNAIIEKPEGKTVADALAQVLAGPLSNPISFDRATIEVQRLDANGVVVVRPVAWDATNQRPKEDTNHQLQPGDRVVIRDNSGFPPPTPVAPAVAEYDRLKSAVAPRGGQPQVLYRAQIIRDMAGSMAEFMPKSGDSNTVVDTATIDATLRILQRNTLIEVLSRAPMATVIGQKTRAIVEEMKSTPKGEVVDGFAIEANGLETEKGLVIAVLCEVSTAENRRTQIETVVNVAEGESAILKFPAKPTANGRDGDAAADDTKPIYVVLTPEIRR